METAESTRDCRVTPEYNTSQCIFYPVKEEAAEVLLGASQTKRGDLSTETSTNALQTDHQAADNILGESLPLTVTLPFHERLQKNLYFNVELFNNR